MRFSVPQFIEIEDKIFGPLTIKQFIYLTGGVGFSFLLFRILPFFFAIIFIIPVMSLSLALAFYQMNNRAFVHTLEAILKYIISEKLYVWKKQKKQAVGKESELLPDPISQMNIPRLSDSKLSDLGWSLDIKDNLEKEMNNN